MSLVHRLEMDEITTSIAKMSYRCRFVVLGKSFLAGYTSGDEQKSVPSEAAKIDKIIG